MTYQTAYKLLVAAYKSAKGIMPEGIDLLKIKQKARQKVIDAKKVIQFPPDRITNPFKPRPTETEIMMKKTGIPVTVKGKTTTMTPDGILKMLMGKGKGKDVKIGQAPKTTKRKPTVDPKLTQEENIKRIMAENKASAKRLQEKMNKPEKTLGEKLKDYKGDPDAMRDGGKVKKKRKHDDNIDEEDIGEGESKKRFLNKMPKPRNYPNLSEEEIILDKMPRPKRSDGIMELAVGGMTNISDTYDNNPTLQSQYPNKQDYLDLFSSQTTTTTPEVAAIPETTTSTIAPINPIKPIIPLPQDSGDSGGITTIQPRAPKEDLNFRERMAQLNLQMGVPVEEEEKSFFDKIKQFSPTLQFMDYTKTKAAQAQQAIEDFFERQRKAKAARELENRIRSQSPSGSMDYGPSGYEGMSDAASDQERSEGGRGSRG